MKSQPEAPKTNGAFQGSTQRMEIFREVAMSEDPLIQKRSRKLSLLELGLIATLGASRKTVRFDANMDLYHHF
jgi:hypothetical protein